MISFNGIKNIIQGIKKSSPSLYLFLYTLWLRRKFCRNKKKISGKFNFIRSSRAVLNGVTFDIAGDNNSIEIDTHAVMNNVLFYVRGNSNKVLIGTECGISHSSIWIEDHTCVVNIGRKTTFGGVHLAATENFSKVIIGDDCMLAQNIEIRTGDSHGIYDQSGRRINQAEDVIIGEHVWVATHATILKGSRIGRDSIVGTGAVVTKGYYPEGCILAGNPAEIVKRGIRWDRNRSNIASAAEFVENSLKISAVHEPRRR